MSQRIIYSVMIFVLLVGPSNANSENTTHQSNNSSQGSNPQVVQIPDEEAKRVRDQQDVLNVLKYLEEIKKREEEFREQEKQQCVKKLIKIKILDSKVRKQIDHLLNWYKSRQPLNDIYSQQFNAFNKDVTELRQLIKEQQVQQTREYDRCQLQFVQEQLAKRIEYEDRLQRLEQLPRGETAKKQRETEQLELKNIAQTLQKAVERLSDWHKMNQSLNLDYKIISLEVKQNFESFIIIIKQIDQRRIKERLAEVNKIEKIKGCLDKQRRNELEQRAKEQPPKSEMLLIQRKKDEFIGDRLDRAIRKRIVIMEQQLSEKMFLDKSYDYQRKLLNQGLIKFRGHFASVQERRRQERNDRHRNQ